MAHKGGLRGGCGVAWSIRSLRVVVGGMDDSGRKCRIRDPFPEKCHGMRGSRTHLPGRLETSAGGGATSPNDSERPIDLEHASPVNHLVDGTEFKFCHGLPQTLSNADEVDDGFLVTGKLRTKLRVMSRNTHGARIG